MTRTLIMFLIFSTPFSIKADINMITDHFVQEVLGFEKHWNPFIRKLFGCPLDGPTDAATCQPKLGTYDFAEFKKSKNVAKKLFELKEKEK